MEFRKYQQNRKEERSRNASSEKRVCVRFTYSEPEYIRGMKIFYFELNNLDE